jgi:hypothetical protein
MTRTHRSKTLVRSGLVAALLGVALLIASARPGSAGEIAPTPVSATQSPDASQSGAAPATSPSLVGAAGFGWG